jgi:apolipoprotein N-acyltransferase
VVQGNIPQYMKHEAYDATGPQTGSSNEIFRTYLELTATGVSLHPETELVIWPETMFPYRITAVPGARGDEHRAGVARALRYVNRASRDRPLIVGGHYRTKDDEHQNAAFLIDAGGALHPEHYAKVHAVPGGEYIPFRAVAPKSLVDSVKEIVRSQAGFRPEVVEGWELVLFQVGETRYAPLICYEICYPALTRDARRLGADVILNLTNYGWFPGTHQPEQANQIAVFRAVESRVPVVVAANTGISAIISPRGETKEIDVRGRAREVKGVLAAAVPLTDDRPPGLLWGDLPFALAAVMLLAGLLHGLVCRILERKREERS